MAGSLQPPLAHAWRFACLGGLSGGLATAPALGGRASLPTAVAAAVGLGVLAIVAPRRAATGAGGSVGIGTAGAVWLACLALAACVLGLALGAARLAAIDAGALDLGAGTRVTATGFVTAVPRRSEGHVRIRVQTADGRLMVEAPEPVPDLSVGTRVRASGVIRDPGEWEAGYLRRIGVADLLSTREVAVLPGARGGLAGHLDAIRSRAERALGEGTSDDAASLLRGFVLGQDDRIDAVTVGEFKRSGLAHLLAVSGMNVVLLAVLAGVVLAVLGVSLRARLLCILGLIAVYVPVTGAGPSIQRAGVMGAAGVVAALAGRPRSRWYAVLLAAALTLGADPRAGADVGWQLSFAAVIGILAASGSITAALGGSGSRVRRALAEGAGLTMSATLATAPLMAFHFGTLSVVALPANLLAAPAEAPVMWLGMLAAALGQQDLVPVEPLTWLAGMAAGYVAQVASWMAAPGWAQLDLGPGNVAGLFESYAAIAAATTVALRWAARRRGLGGGLSARRAARVAPVLVAATAAFAIAALLATGDRSAPPTGLRVVVLDVGQGSATLLAPADGDPVLVDAGPPDADVAGQLESLGVERLAALAISHPQLDHEGGAPDVLGRVPTERLAFARVGRATLGAARLAGTEAVHLYEGDSIASGSLRLEALWPERQAVRARAAGGDPNLLSLVLLARWHGFELLLPGDAEAESVPLDPGPIDALEVSHHGSADSGLDRLLERADPRLAVISVGADNPYGHPAASTVAALGEQGVATLRTDETGPVTIDVSRGAWSFAAG